MPRVGYDEKKLKADVRARLKAARGEGTIVEVPSRTTNEIHRVVVLADGTLTCSCKGYLYNQRCWHSRLVAEELDEFEDWFALLRIEL